MNRRCPIREVFYKIQRVIFLTGQSEYVLFREIVGLKHSSIQRPSSGIVCQTDQQSTLSVLLYEGEREGGREGGKYGRWERGVGRWERGVGRNVDQPK